jgi:hypothetical protein
MTPPRDDEFFVGYLPLPKSLRRPLLLIVVVTLSLLMAAGYVFASTTAGAGRGKFAFGKAEGTLGLLTVKPEAMLWTVDPTLADGVRGTLLVRQGKFGLSKRAAALDGELVRVKGATVARDGHRMIELAADPLLAGDASAAERAALQSIPSRDLGEVTLRGEIVDSKCYLGRMRPGDQRTHRACAQLCIAGGIPPLFVARAADGVETQYLLSTYDGASLAEPLMPFVAEPVEIRGRVVQRGDVQVLQTDVQHVSRL